MQFKVVHSSVEDAQKEENKPISLKDCLELFTMEEQLGQDEVRERDGIIIFRII